MKTRLLMLTMAVACTFAGNAMSMTKDEYTAQKSRVSADLKANKDKCSAMKANAKDICMAEAQGAEKVA